MGAMELERRGQILDIFGGQVSRPCEWIGCGGEGKGESGCLPASGRWMGDDEPRHPSPNPQHPRLIEALRLGLDLG